MELLAKHEPEHFHAGWKYFGGRMNLPLF